MNNSSHLAHFCLVFVLALSFLGSYLLAGVFGLAVAALGMASTSVLLMSCSLFGSVASQAEAFVSYASEIKYNLVRRIYEIAYSSRTYRSYQPTINASGVFVINMVGIALVDIMSTNQKMLKWDLFLFFGIIIGMGIAYFLKGTGIFTLNSLLKEIVISGSASGREIHRARDSDEAV